MLTIPRPQLEPHHVDILGLALIAVGVFLAGVAYLGWSGGAVGQGAIGAARLMLGVAGYAVPMLVASGGVLVAIRDLCPSGRPIRAGVACLTAAVTLALAAGTLGIGPGAASGRRYWQPSALRARGGVIGQAELWVTSHLISNVGADILALFLFAAAVMLISHATAAGIARSARAGLVRTGRTAKRSSDGLRATLTRGLAADRVGPIAMGAPTSCTHQTGLSHEGDTTELAVAGMDAVRAVTGSQESRGDPELHPDAQVQDRDDCQQEDGVGQATGSAEPILQPHRESATDGDRGFSWRVPPKRLLVRSTGDGVRPDTAGQEEIARTLLETLGHFGIEAELAGRVTGPHITRYELRLAPGTKIAKVTHLGDDLAYALAATDIRILAPIPGKQAVGVEVPNARRCIVHLGDVFDEAPPDWSPLAVWLGKDIAGRALGADLAMMPHLLVAGTTGAGKSACLNTMLCSVLLRATPDEVRFVLVDPKQVELNHYDAIPHLLTPVLTSPRSAANALQNLIVEMEHRYATMSLARTRSLPELNRVRDRRGEPPLPYILCVIDELADLMMVSPAEVEDAIIRLAQKARAVGIHLLLATQSPRADVITGMIKANVPSRIAFAVSSQTDSRVILDQGGAESLLGQGDMLFSPLGGKVQRLQGAYIDEQQIAEVTDAWRRQGEPELHEELLEEPEGDDGAGAEERATGADEDPLLEDAVALVAQVGTASTSMLQRRLRLGYTRAGRLIDMLERRGVISGYEGSKPRQVLISASDVSRILAQLAGANELAGQAGPRTKPDGSDDRPAGVERQS